MMKSIILTAFACLAATMVTAAEPEGPLWEPMVGQQWHYQVSVTVQKGTDLPKNIPNQKIEELDGRVRATYPQVVVYRGLQRVEKEKKKDSEKPAVAHDFTVFNGNQLVETQFMQISDTAVDAIGVHPAGSKVRVFTKPIPLISKDWKGGEFFTYMLGLIQNEKNVRIIRKCKVIGWENLETQAGKFRSLHIQTTGRNGQMEIKRSYWFAPGTGFVKEVKKYYVGERTIFTQIRVLEKTGKS